MAQKNEGVREGRWTTRRRLRKPSSTAIKEQNKLLEEKQGADRNRAFSRPIAVTTGAATSEATRSYLHQEPTGALHRVRAPQGVQPRRARTSSTISSGLSRRSPAMRRKQARPENHVSEQRPGRRLPGHPVARRHHRPRTSARRRRCASSPASRRISSDALEYILDNDEADAGWVGETQATPRDQHAQALSKLTIPVSEIYAQPKATQKLIDDAAIDVEAWLARKVAEKFTRMENTAFMVGDRRPASRAAC